MRRGRDNFRLVVVGLAGLTLVLLVVAVWMFISIGGLPDGGRSKQASNKKGTKSSVVSQGSSAVSQGKDKDSLATKRASQRSANRSRSANSKDTNLSQASYQAPSRRQGKPIQKPPMIDVTTKEPVQYSNLEREIGVSKRKLEQRRSGLLLRFDIFTQPRCMLGDIDVIKKDLNYASDKNLLISIESLLPQDSSFQPVVRKVSLEKLASGYQMSFSIPPSKAARHLGIFLCSDSQGKGHCFSGQKRIKDLNKIYAEYVLYETKERKQPGVAQRPKAKDAVYYFNYLLVEGDTLTVLSDQMGEKEYAKLKGYLRPLLSAEQVNKVVKRVQVLSNVLKSISVAVQGQRMALNMPRMDIHKCDIVKKAKARVQKKH